MGSLEPAESVPDRTAEFIQPESFIAPQQFSGRKTPLFLIHDGGGTVFTYHCFETIGRFVFGIANPRWESGGSFEGGIQEMGALYAQYIRNTIAGEDFPAAARRQGAKVEILLGGWSLGGFLSLEVARQMADDPTVRVTGIVMIDSPYLPKDTEWREQAHGSSSAGFDFNEEGKSKNQIRVQRAMKEARRMLASWEIPAWQGNWQASRPKTILLRAKECVPTKEGEGRSMIDRFREDSKLGWGELGDDYLESMDIPGDHFTLSKEPLIPETSKALKKACDSLDRVSKGAFFH